MGWLGKVLGGGLGFVFGGPIGALFGAGLGHMFYDERRDAGGVTARMSGAETRQAAFFTTVFAMLAKMAKADGRVSPEEIAMVERIMEERLHLSPEARRVAISIFTSSSLTFKMLGRLGLAASALFTRLKLNSFISSTFL